MRSTVTDYSLFTLLSLFTHLFAPSPVLLHFSFTIYSFVCPLTRPSDTLSKSGEGKLNSCIIRMELQKEKLFEDNSVSRAKAWSENDFSFKYVICAQHCNGLFTLHHSLFTHLDANLSLPPPSIPPL